MKPTLILSVLAILFIASTASFAPGYATYFSGYGNAQQTSAAAPASSPYGNAHPTINARSRFTASDFGSSQRGPLPQRLHTPGH